jgi:hypothetical protein
MFTFLEKAMIELSTPIYILTILAILAACGTALFIGYKLVILVINTLQGIAAHKKFKVGKDGIAFENDMDNIPTNLIDNNIKVVNDSGQTFSDESLVTLIYEMQALFDEYYDRKRDIKLQAIADQLKKFDSERKTFMFIVQDKYLASLSKTEKYDSYNMLFHYWFITCFNESDEEIRDILNRNHLKEKTADEYTDIINQLFDTTYSQVLSHIETAPNFIINHTLLKSVFVGFKNEYREYLDHSLQNAKKVSEKAAEDRRLVEEEFNAKKSDIVHRTFPTVDSDKILRSIRKE